MVKRTLGIDHPSRDAPPKHRDAGLKLGIIIVNYGKASRLTLGLQSIKRQNFCGTISVSVLDNSSNEDQRNIIRSAILNNPSVNLVESTGNLGYSRGMNAASSFLPKSDYILFMSPDIILDDVSILQKLVDTLESVIDIGILATTQVNDDGSIVEVARRFPNLGKQIVRRLSQGRLYQDTELLPSSTVEGATAVEWVQSSFCMVRTSVWTRLAGFDERLFIFMADTDLSRRAKRLGWKTAIAAISGVRADGVRASSGSILSMLRSRSMRIHVADAIRYYLYRPR